MKGMLLGLAALGVLGAVPFVAVDQEGGGTAVKTASIKEGKKAAQRYRLRVLGRGDDCTVAKGSALGAGRSELKMAAQCASLMPRLADVRYWQEGANGAVVLAAADGRVIAEFYAADGVAYESLRPASPPMDLTAQ